MSHVFISYAHDDQKQFGVLDRFIEELTKAGFTDDDIWYDGSIEAGTRWRVEIDTALEESFAVVVLLAPASMKSRYVTYEWSWAVGNGTPLFPLVLEGSYDDIHPRLLDLHCMDCRQNIPSHILETVKETKENPPDTVLLNRLIVNETRKARIGIRTVLWLYSNAHSGSADLMWCHSLLQNISVELQHCAGVLTEMIVDKSHAFTTKQRRKCRALIEELNAFWEMLYDQSPTGVKAYSFRLLAFSSSELSDFEDFRRGRLEPIFMFFEEADSLGSHSYNSLDHNLEAISKGNAGKSVSAKSAIMMVFPDNWQEILDSIEQIRRINLQ